MTPIEQAIEALARCTPYMYKAAPIETYVAHCTVIAALRAQPASLPRLNEAQIDRILGCLDPADGGHDEIEKFLGDYLRAPPDHSELVKDAVRYRWLRTWEIDSYLATGKLEQLDAEIDRAMAADALEGK